MAMNVSGSKAGCCSVADKNVVASMPWAITMHSRLGPVNNYLTR